MGQRSRKRGRRAKASPGPSGDPGAPPGPSERPAVNRSEQRNAAVRATLEPLAEGERPGAVSIGAALAAVIGAGNLIAYAAGVKIAGKHPAAGGIILFSAMMLVCSGGMWRMRYWAVLGFQALLAIVVLLFTLLLVRASNLLGLAISLAMILSGGFLFYKLVRALSRIQMPKYTSR